MTELACHMRASDSIRSALSIVHPEKRAVTLGVALDSVLIIDGIARLIDEAMQKCRTADGRIDTRDVAHAILVRMDQLRGAHTQRAVDRVDDAKVVNTFATLLTEAIEMRQRQGGELDLRAAAAHVFAAMQENRR